MASFEDVVAAFAVHHVATQESLFPWIGDWDGSELINTTGGALRYDLFIGLMFERFCDGASPAMAATRVSPPPSSVGYEGLQVTSDPSSDIVLPRIV